MSAAKQLGKKLGGTVVAGGVGAAVYGLNVLAMNVIPGVKAKAGETPDEQYARMNKYSYFLAAPPVLALALGHYVKGKPKFAASGVAACGAAGFALAQAISTGVVIRKNNVKPAAGGTNGFGETGALMGPGDFRALNENDVGALLSASEFGSGAPAANSVIDEAMGLG